jgi:uncharacterized protein YigA (DUF484 family)
MTKDRTIALQAAEIQRLRDEITVDEQRVADLMGDVHRQDAEIDKLRDLLLEIWRHRNGGSALSSSWDRRVTEVLETNGPT